MFPAIAILICMMELSFPHLYGVESDFYYALWQLQMVLLCILALFSDGSQRDRSVFTVLLLWQTWLVTSDMFLIAAPLPASLEATGFTSLVLWALIRPYFFASATRSDRTVHIAFYKGDHAPLLSSLGALVGLPFSSVAIVAGNTAIRASGNGKMVISEPGLFFCDDFVCIDTGIEPGPEFFKKMAKCTGKPTKAFGIFRTKCVANLEPLLDEIGYAPRSFWHRIPSIFYYQCVRQAHG